MVKRRPIEENQAMSLRSVLFGRKPIPPEAAGLVLLHFVDVPGDLATARYAELSGAKKGAFLDKERLYKVSAVMLCILSCEKEDKRYGDVRMRFQELALPKGHDEEFLRSYHTALSELENLASSSVTPLSWARQWFATIGVNIVNPVDLGLFATRWLQLMYHARKALDEVGTASG
jgi:hypothetical protein